MDNIFPDVFKRNMIFQQHTAAAVDRFHQITVRCDYRLDICGCHRLLSRQRKENGSLRVDFPTGGKSGQSGRVTGKNMVILPPWLGKMLTGIVAAIVADRIIESVVVDKIYSAGSQIIINQFLFMHISMP